MNYIIEEYDIFKTVNLFSASSSEEKKGDKNLSATKRSSFKSWALNTTPIPPPPSFLIIL